MELCAKAHMYKRDFIRSILELGDRGPLSMLCIKHDGEEYLRFDKAKYLIGLLGLEEMVRCMTGFSLHESEDAMQFGLAVLKYMDLKCQDLTERYGFQVVMEQTPAESTAYRFARLDLNRFDRIAPLYVKGNLDSGEVYYTNSTHLKTHASVDAITRVFQEGRFHPMIKAGAITHVWLGEHRPDAGSMASFVKKIFKETENAQVAFSPEFTECNNCGRVFRGKNSGCPACGSSDLDCVTRITGYFTKTSNWNAGKRGELKDRVRLQI